MAQGSLPFATTIQEISDAEIMRRCKSQRDALRVCVELSGLAPKDVAYQLEIDPAHFSRMISGGEDRRHFPPDLGDKLMDICGNEVPLRYAALSRGYGLHKLKSRLEEENEALQRQLDEQQVKLRAITEFLKEVKGV